MNRRSFVYPVFVCLLALGAGLQANAQSDEWHLSLDECLRIGLENNYDLVSARIDPEVSAETVKSRDGVYDPSIFVTPQKSGFKRERRTQFETAGRGDTIEVTAGVRQELKFGGVYQTSLNYSRENGSNVLFEPFYQSVLTIQYDQPLLNDFGKTAHAEQFLLAKGNLEVSREELRRQTELTVQQIENAFWDLAASRQAYTVALESRQRAMDLLELNRKKVEVGTLAPIEITQAEAGVAGEEENVIVTETALRDAEDELRRLLAIPTGDPRWMQTIVPSDLPEYREVSVDVDDAIDTALRHRPELISARQQLDNTELSERAARNRVKHGLDLGVLLQPFGNNNDGATLGMDMNGDPIFIFDQANAGKAFTEIFDLENYFWRVNVTWSVPIGNKTNKANYRIAKLNTSKAEIDITNQEQTIRVEVRQAARAVSSGVQRVAAARKNVELQQKKLEAEQKKFENGMSTSFEVLTFQNDLLDAELARIRALVDYVKAITALERVKGTMLDARNLTLITDVPQVDG